MAAKHNDLMQWNDNEFQKLINEDNYYIHRRILISQKDKRIENCIWCGQKFLKNHHSEKYCCDECRVDAKRQQLRNRSHRWYHRHKHELSEKQRWGLGSGTLGEHMHDDFEKEQSVIQKELQRLKIKRKW